MKSFENLAESAFDEAFTKIVHTNLYQIRLLRHNPIRPVAANLYYKPPGINGVIISIAIKDISKPNMHAYDPLSDFTQQLINLNDVDKVLSTSAARLSSS